VPVAFPDAGAVVTNYIALDAKALKSTQVGSDHLRPRLAEIGGIVLPQNANLV